MLPLAPVVGQVMEAAVAPLIAAAGLAIAAACGAAGRADRAQRAAALATLVAALVLAAAAVGHAVDASAAATGGESAVAAVAAAACDGVFSAALSVLLQAVRSAAFPTALIVLGGFGAALTVAMGRPMVGALAAVAAGIAMLVLRARAAAAAKAAARADILALRQRWQEAVRIDKSGCEVALLGLFLCFAKCQVYTVGEGGAGVWTLGELLLGKANGKWL
jgi:hypothetical protein